MAYSTVDIAIATSYYFQLPLTLLAIFLAYQLLRKAINEAVVLKSGANRRRLGNFEESFQIVSDQREGSGDICVVLSMLSETKLPKDLVREALVKMAQRQPMLRAVVKPQCSNSIYGGNERLFEIIDSNDVPTMIDLSCYDDVSASRWQEICADMIGLRKVLGMKLSQLSWQAVLLKEEYLTESGNYANTLMFRCRHCIMGGVSCMKFCEQFLSCLNNKEPQGTKFSSEIESLDLHPSLYEYLKSIQAFSIWKFLLAFYPTKAILKLLFKRNQGNSIANRAEKPDSFFTEKSTFPLKQNFVCKVFSESETSFIIKACKENKATVTATLEAVAHMVYCRLLQEDGSFVIKENIEFVNGLAINARRYCNPSPHEDYLGNFAVVLPRSLPYCVESAEFWSLARESTKGIRELVKQGAFIQKQQYVNDLFSPQEFVDDLFIRPEATDEEVLNNAKKASCNFISSKGPFNFANEETSTYKSHECLSFVLSHGLPRNFYHFITTTNGKMAWVILSHPRTTLEFSQKFFKRCFDFVQNMANL